MCAFFNFMNLFSQHENVSYMRSDSLILYPPHPTGWLWSWPAHLPTVRSVLSGRPEALLSGGLRNRCCDLHPGNLSLTAAQLNIPPAEGKSQGKLFFSIFSQALSTESIERLPVYNKSAWKHYKTIHEADDWCVPSKEPKDMTTFRSF